MTDVRYQLLATITKGDGTTANEISGLEKILAARLRPDHKEILICFNGLAGYLNESTFMNIWSVEELRELNSAYRVSEFAPGMLLIGSTGGGEAIAYEHGIENPPVLHMPFVGLSRARAERVASSLEEYLLRAEPLRPMGSTSDPTLEIVEVKPILLGGSPSDPSNKRWLTRMEHIQFVTFWNETLGSAGKPQEQQAD